MADGVAAHGRFAFADVFFKEGNEGGFGLGLGGGAGFDFVDEAAAFVGALVPCVHFGEEFVALVDDLDGAGYAHGEVGAGDDDGDFKQALFFGVEAAHFAVEPDEVVVVFG